MITTIYLTIALLVSGAMMYMQRDQLTPEVMFNSFGIGLGWLPYLIEKLIVIYKSGGFDE